MFYKIKDEKGDQNPEAVLKLPPVEKRNIMFYSKEEFVRYAKQQIIVNNDLIKGWQLVAKGVKKFDEKVINIRLTRYIDETLKNEFEYAFFSFEIHQSTTWFSLAVRDNDNFPSVRGSSVTYVDYQSDILAPGITSENKRIDAEAIIINIDKRIEGLKKASKQLQTEIDNIDNIYQKFEAIENQIKEFNSNHSEELKELCKF